jgi:hypothetical protein
MEKQAVVREGKSPSLVSGKTSCMVKNGVALAKGEHDSISNAEELLAKKMTAMYNKPQT